jgi:hypothetical protein
MKTTILSLVLAAVAFAQTPVNQSGGPPPSAIQKLFYYDGSSNLTYICNAAQNGRSTSVKRSDSSLTNIVVSTNVGTVTTAAVHGLYIGARVTISGATVDTDLNGT